MFSRHPRESGNPLRQALRIYDWEAIYWITRDAMHCGGDPGLPPGQRDSILTCSRVPEPQKGGPP